MLKQQWSSTGHRSMGGLFYFVLNIGIPPVLLGSGHLQTPAGSMEQAREGSNSSCISQRQNETARGPCFFSRGFCRAGIWQQRWAGSTCTPGGRDLAAGGGWMLVQTLLWVSNTDGRGREAKFFLPKPCVLPHAVKAKLFCEQFLCSQTWEYSAWMKWESCIPWEREEGNEIRTALPTTAQLSHSLRRNIFSPISTNQ